MSSYIKPTPSHSGLTSLFGGDQKTGEYFHLHPNVYAFVGPLFSGSAVVSAVTYYSGSTPLNDLLAPGTTTYVQPGTNISTGGTPSRPTINLNGTISLGRVQTNELVVNDLTEFDGIVVMRNELNVHLGSLVFSSNSAFFTTEVAQHQVLHTITPFGVPFQRIVGNPNFSYVPDDDLLTAGNFSGQTVRFNDKLYDSNDIHEEGFFYFKQGGEVLPGIIRYEGGAGVSVIGSISAATLYSGVSNVGSLFAPASVVSTYVQPGTNVATGGTASRPIVHVIGSPVFTAVTASSVSGTSVSAITYFSGSTDVGSLFAPISVVPTYVQPGTNVATGGTPSRPVVHVIGSPVFTGVTAQSVSGTTVSATTYFSGSTDIGSLFAPASTVATYVQPGTNVATGGTPSMPVVHVIGSPVFTGVTAQSVSGTSISATTYFSGNTDVGALFASISVVPTYVQPGTNIVTGGTASRPIVHLIESPSVTGLTFSSFLKDISGNFATGVYFKSGFSDNVVSNSRFYYESIAGLLTLNQGENGGLNVDIGGVTGATIRGISISGTSVSATTFYSGSTNLNNLFGGQSYSTSTGVTTVNFGFSSGSEGDFTANTVSDVNVTSNSSLSFRIIPSIDHPDPEDSLLDGVVLRESDIVNATSFTLNAYAENGSWGIYTVVYKIVN